MKCIISITLSLLSTLSNMNAQQLKKVVYSDSLQQLSGWVSSNTNSNKPGVLILPAWMGMDEEAKTAALNLEKEGYIAFIADIYGDGNIPTDAKEARVISSFYKTNYEAYQKRIAIALEELINQGADRNKIAVIGYCFGGTGALEAARAQLKVQGVVSIHGGLGKGDRPDGAINTKVLVLHGAEDASVSQEDIQNFTKEMNNAHVDWQMIYYANSKHTFTNPESSDYNEIMANRSWMHNLLFLKEILK